MNNPFSACSYASRVFQDHESKSEIHKTAMLRKHNFLDTPENKQKYIDLTTIHSKNLDQTVSENGAKLTPIVDSGGSRLEHWGGPFSLRRAWPAEFAPKGVAGRKFSRMSIYY